MSETDKKADETRQESIAALEEVAETNGVGVPDEDTGLVLPDGTEAEDSEATETDEAGDAGDESDSVVSAGADPLMGFNEDELAPALEIYSRGELAELVRSKPSQAFRLISRLQSGAKPEKRAEEKKEEFASEEEIAKDFAEQFDDDAAKSMAKAMRKYLSPMAEQIKKMSDSEQRRRVDSSTAEFRSKVESVFRKNPEIYGDASAKDKQETRGAAAGVARLLLDGARVNGIPITLEDAVEAGHRYVAYTGLKGTTTKEIAGQIVRRSAMRTIPPGKARGGVAPKASPRDETLRLMNQIAGKT